MTAERYTKEQIMIPSSIAWSVSSSDQPHSLTRSKRVAPTLVHELAYIAKLGLKSYANGLSDLARRREPQGGPLRSIPRRMRVYGLRRIDEIHQPRICDGRDRRLWDRYARVLGYPVDDIIPF